MTRGRSSRRARNAWSSLVTAHGERRAFTELAAHVGGSDRAYRALAVHGIATDLG